MAPAKRTPSSGPSATQVQRLARKVVQDGLKSPAYKQLTKALAQTPEQLRALNTAAGYSRMTASVTESKMPVLCWGGSAAGKAVARDVRDLERDLGRLLRDLSKLVVSKPTKPRAAAKPSAAKPAATKAAPKAAPRKRTTTKAASARKPARTGRTAQKS